MKELYAKFHKQMKQRAWERFSRDIANVDNCSQPSELEIIFRNIERWAGEQKRLAQRVRSVNNRGVDATVKLKRILEGML